MYMYEYLLATLVLGYAVQPSVLAMLRAASHCSVVALTIQKYSL